MVMNYTLLATLFIVFIVVNSADPNLEVKSTSDAGLGPNSPVVPNQNNSLNEKTGGFSSNLDAKNVEQFKKSKDQVDGSALNTNLIKDNSSKQLEAKDAQIVQRDRNNRDAVTDSDKKGNANKGLESKEKHKEGVLPAKKESFGVEECDPANRCTDEKNALVACLRVPGNESPDLSLLIQNKGKGSRSIKISAPVSVQLEKTQILLHEKEDQELKFSIGNGGTDSLIVLTAEYGNCSLDFKNLIAHNSKKEAEFNSQSTYINFVKRSPSLGFIFLAALLIMALLWTCVRLWRKHSRSSGSKYQNIGMELPVSGGGKMESDSNDGWDNSWGDSWDDEETPKTPSMPVTPSLSAKGIASRRINKEAWRD